MTIKSLDQYPQQPLNESNTSVLMQLLLLDKQSVDKASLGMNDDLSQVLEKDQMCQLITKRAEYHGLKMTGCATLLIARLSQGVPGRAVQFLHALAANSTADQLVSVEDFCMMFPMGIPDEAGFSAAWDEQKDGGANRIDNPANWTRKQ